MKAICAVCEEEFEQKKSNQVVCGEDCRKRRKRDHNREYERIRRASKPELFREADLRYRESHPEKFGGKIARCEACKKEFRKIGNKKTCSTECSKEITQERARISQLNIYYSDLSVARKKARERAKKWREADPEKQRANMRRSRSKRRLQYNLQARKYYEQNPELYRERARKYRLANRGKHLEALRKSRRKRRAKTLFFEFLSLSATLQERLATYGQRPDPDPQRP